MIGVYRIYCKSNKRSYVGSAVSCEDRGKSHYWHLNKGDHGNKHLQNAWNKYGSNNFVFEVLEVCSEPELFDREQEWINLFNATVKGFNIANPVRQSVPSKRMSEAHKKYWNSLTEEQKQERTAAGKALLDALRNDPQFRLNLGTKAAARWGNPEFRTKVQKIFDDNWANPEFREKQIKHRKANANKLWASEAHRQAMSEKRAERWKDPQYVKERTEGTTKLWQDSEYRKKVTDRIKASCNDPEYKRLLSERTKLQWQKRREKQNGVKQ
ncbi:MAG TPA: GIY-YIG nuclease family protein [Candidatus Angelobacter sp.]|nr:GIY-YIG nuclease family protein [Candidatus Angelobacter sp.]